MSRNTSWTDNWETDSHSRTYSTTRLADTSGRISRKLVRRRRLRRWWRRRRRRLRRSFRRSLQTVTPVGWFTAVVMMVTLAIGLRMMWVEALVTAAIAAILLGVAVPFLVGSRTYEVVINVERTRVVAGRGLGIELDVRNSSARPALSAMAELPVGDMLREILIPMIRPHGSVTIPVPLNTTQRGVLTVGPLTLARRDPLGLLSRDLKWKGRHRIYVHPRTVNLPTTSAGLVRDLEGTASTRLTDADLSFHAVREYVPGDQMRHVHWKSTAKTGEIMVRQYEESQTARAAVLLDSAIGEYGSDDEVELAVSVAASTGLQAVYEGRERLVVSGWTPPRRRPSLDGLEEIPSLTPSQLLDSFSEFETVDDGPRVEALIQTLAHTTRDLSVVTIVLGAKVSVARIRRALQSFPTNVHVRVIRCEVLADPNLQYLDGTWYFTVGQIEDLPLLMTRQEG